jgi:hypothetical protein
MVWLRPFEMVEYRGGRRVFTIPTRVAKLRVVDPTQ